MQWLRFTVCATGLLSAAIAVGQPAANRPAAAPPLPCEVTVDQAGWNDPAPLTAEEKADILRAAVGYALAQDSLGLGRFRDKYAAKMSGPDDRAAFEVAMKPASGSVAAFSQLAKMAASVDTINGFLRDMKARFADTLAQAPPPHGVTAPDPTPTGTLPRIVGASRAGGTR